MKRRNSENDGDKINKRVNLSPDASRAALFDSPQNQRYIGEILRNKEVADMPGYILGTIYLVYPYQSDKIQIDLHTEDSEIGRNRVHLEVVFGKHCTSRLLRRNVRFSPNQRVFFSLQGGSFVSDGGIPRLKFSKRVMFKMGEGENMVVIDEWDLNAHRQSLPAEWWEPPKEERVAVPLPNPNKLKKNERKRLRAQEHFLAKSKNLLLEKPAPSILKPNTAVADISHTTTPSPVSKMEIKPLADPLESSLNLQAGRLCKTMRLTALANASTVNCFYDIAAVVSQDSDITKCASGDWACSIQLVDPSNRKLSDNSYIGQDSMKINCFMKNCYDAQLLPNVRAGDIIVLSNAKCARFNKTGSQTTNLTGFYDRLAWAKYVDGGFSHGAIPDSVASQNIATDRGPFSPLLQIDDPVLLDYCSKLRLWWLEIELKKKQFFGVRYQIAAPSTRDERPHLLIRDAHPKTKFSGFFDCTVEVIHKHRSEDPRYSIVYLTDFTSNEMCPTYTSNWCPPGLSQSILRVELWDSACAWGEKMEIGAFYSIRNIKMRLAGNQTYEAKMKEEKISKLDPEGNAKGHTALKNLLQRRAEWALKHPYTEPLEGLTYTEVKDLSLRVRANCILRVLDVRLTKSGSAIVFVTDYTANKLFPDRYPTSDRFKQPDNTVLKIILRDSQAEKAKEMKTGDVFVFQKLVVKLYNHENMRDLGGEQKLIHQLSPSEPLHAQLMQGLDNRRNLHESAKLTTVQSESRLSDPLSGKPKIVSSRLRSSLKTCTTIDELESNDDPQVLFSITARVAVVDPCERFVRRYCTKCNYDLVPGKNVCQECNNTNYQLFAFRYAFSLGIEEDGGSDMGLVVYDDAEFLEGMPRVDLQQDQAACNTFHNLLKKMAGNLWDYLAIDEKPDVLGLESPLVYFEGIRYEEGGRRICHLISFTQLDA